MLVPATARAVTVDDIVALSKAGVSEPVILAMIDRDKTVMTIDPQQVVALQKAGVSEKVIIAMLKSGRAEGDAAADANAAFNTTMFLNDRASMPTLVIVGHGPDRPNTGDSTYTAPLGPIYPSLVVIPAYGGRAPRGRAPRHALEPTFEPTFQPTVAPPPPVLTGVAPLPILPPPTTPR